MMYLLFNDMLQLQFFLTSSSLLFLPSAKDAIGEYDELKIYDDALKTTYG